MYPAGNLDAQDMAKQIFDKYAPNLFENIYVGIAQLALTIDHNCAYVQDLVYYLSLLYPNHEVRIFSTSKDTWTAIFGGIN